MAEAIKKWILSIRFEYPRSIFDLSPVDPSLWEDYVLVHKTAEDALRTDEKRVCEALYNAAVKEYGYAG